MLASFSVSVCMLYIEGEDRQCVMMALRFIASYFSVLRMIPLVLCQDWVTTTAPAYASSPLLQSVSQLYHALSLFWEPCLDCYFSFICAIRQSSLGVFLDASVFLAQVFFSQQFILGIPYVPSNIETLCMIYEGNPSPNLNLSHV